MFETEGDTLANTFDSDYGNYYFVTLKSSI